MEWFSKLMKEIATFFSFCGAPAVKVSMDILQQVAQGGTTVQQVSATVADLATLNQAIAAAADACSKMDGTETHSVVSPETAAAMASNA